MDGMSNNTKDCKPMEDEITASQEEKLLDPMGTGQNVELKLNEK